MIKFLKQFILGFLKNKNKVDKNGNAHGYWEDYFPNGNLCFKGLYIHGKRHGYWEEYKYNGQLWFKGYYYMGEELYQTSKDKIML